MTETCIHLIGVPLDLGAGRRGVGMGPNAMRLAGLRARLQGLGHRVIDHGNLAVADPETTDTGDPTARYAREIWLACDALRAAVASAFAAGGVPVVLGGDHSATIGSLAAAAAIAEKAGEALGVIWIDAHGDINTPETSPTGNVHGMPLAVSLGLGEPTLVGLGGVTPKVAPERVALLGLRAVDRRERRALKETGVRVYTMTEIDERGMATCIHEAIERVTAGTRFLHVSFDIDGVDPGEASGVGTPAPGGLTYREAHLLMELLAATERVTSVDMVEVNPILDTRNTTASLAVELLASVLGQRIL